MLIENECTLIKVHQRALVKTDQKSKSNRGYNGGSAIHKGKKHIYSVYSNMTNLVPISAIWPRRSTITNCPLQSIMRFYSILIAQGMLGVTIIITTTVAYYLKHEGAAQHFICDKARIANILNGFQNDSFYTYPRNFCSYIK